jgi:hypothetical protein
MSNRFHSKFHRQNHHTYGNIVNADSSHDPIATNEQPFQGDFVLQGALNCYAPASAAAGFFSSDYTTISAIAGQRGGYFYSRGLVGIETYSAQGVALSGYGSYTGANFYSNVYGAIVYGGTYAIKASSPYYGIFSKAGDVFNVGSYAGGFESPTRALSASGGTFGLDVTSSYYGINSYGDSFGANIYSPNIGISAYGGILGLDVISPLTAINASGSQIAGSFYSPSTAVHVNGGSLGLRVKSNNVGAIIDGNKIALSTGNVSIFNGPIGLYRTPLTTHGASSGIVLDIKGNSYFDGDVTITGDISAFGKMSYFDTTIIGTSSLEIINVGGLSAAATFIQYGSINPTLVCYDGDVSLTVPTFTVLNSSVGIGTANPTDTLCVSGTMSVFAPNGPTYGSFNIMSDTNVNGTQVSIGGLSGAYIDLSTPYSDDYDLRIWTGRSDIGGGYTPGNAIVTAVNGPGLKFQTNGLNANSTQMVILSSGNVGIGTTTPNVLLSVNGAISANNTFYSTNSRVKQGIPDNADSSTNGYAFGADGDTGMFSPIVGGGSTNGIVSFYSNNSEAARISGNTLTVYGDLSASTLKITNNIDAASLISTNSISTGAFTTSKPLSSSGLTYSVAATDSSIIFMTTQGVTLPAVNTNVGRWLYLKLAKSVTVTSGQLDIMPLNGGAATNIIFSANTAGKYTWLQSDGTYWQVMAQN